MIVGYIWKKQLTLTIIHFKIPKGDSVKIANCNFVINICTCIFVLATLVIHTSILLKLLELLEIVSYFFKFTRNLEIPALLGTKVVSPSCQLAGQTSPCSSLN